MLEANTLAARVPELLANLEQSVEPHVLPAVQTVQETLLSTLRKQLVGHSRELLSLLPNAALNVLSHAGSLVVIILVPILSFFILKDGRAIRRSMLGILADGSRRDMIQDIAADVHLLLAQYMRALVLLAAAAFIAYGAFFSLIGVPYGILLAAIAFPLEFIPMLGPLAAAVIILMVAGLSGFHHLLWILVFLAVFRVFQDYVLSPHLLSTGNRTPPPGCHLRSPRGRAGRRHNGQLLVSARVGDSPHRLSAVKKEAPGFQTSLSKTRKDLRGQRRGITKRIGQNFATAIRRLMVG